MKDRSSWLMLFLGLTLVRGLLYAAVTLPWQAPDEWGHFEHIWLIAQLERLPTPEDVSPSFERELMASFYEWRYDDFFGGPLSEQMPARLMARQPRTVLSERFSLAYLWSAVCLLPFRHQDLILQLYIVRLSSVLLNLAIVWLAWGVFEELLPRQSWLVVAMTAFVVFLPQHTSINGSVGEGPLAELAAMAVLCGWLRIMRQGGYVRGGVTVLLGTLFGLWTKNTAFFLLPFDALMLSFLIVRHQEISRRKVVRYLVYSLVLVTLLVLVLSQAPTGQRALAVIEQWWSDPQVNLVAQTRFGDEEISLGQVLWHTYDSFWAQFGWMSVRAGDGWYILIYILTVWAVEGWILPRLRCWPVSNWAKVMLGAMLSLAVGVWLAFILFTGRSYHQGRYLFPATVPAAFFLVGGWARWTPKRWQPYFAIGVLIILAALDASAFCLALWPVYYN